MKWNCSSDPEHNLTWLSTPSGQMLILAWRSFTDIAHQHQQQQQQQTTTTIAQDNNLVVSNVGHGFSFESTVNGDI